MASPPTAARQILLVLFPGFNTLDMNGPYEVLAKPGGGNVFKISVASETEITTSAEGVHVKRDIPLDNDLLTQLEKYEILVVPGGPGSRALAQASQVESPFMKSISTFAQLASASSPDGNENVQPSRVLFSICTGALFLGTLGIFDGRFCTTHWGSFDLLKQNVQKGAKRTGSGRPGTVVAARFVDSGANESGVRIISSGGVSCGIDASLYVVKLYCGEDEAKAVADTLEYAWRKTEGFVVL